MVLDFLTTVATIGGILGVIAFVGVIAEAVKEWFR